ncbi:VOC family protein [Sphingomicrobium sediminis]|uniref:VOC family protein n=1 Tax=Sphingomicrobium sediminis TaxID=2950949 RepID=A0A9X2EHW6_9SPHN|nr:VOC family protein [Sphingomicrobium sediminis]MCM8558345.1 VOC family protein [Sphingomicrobium sediminis]
MAKITGIGGVFIKRADQEKSTAWYKDVLGIAGEYGPSFRWKDEPHEDPFSLLSSFPEDTNYLDPGTQPFMLNFRVDDLDGFQKELEEKGVEILGRQDEPYGKFAWILDPDGIKIELWEQIGPAPSE